MKVHGIRCRNCDDIVYSRARHDCRHCTCGASYIDGGQESYTRVGFKDKPPLSVTVVIPNLNKKVLYDDWNRSKDKLGIIRKANHKDFTITTRKGALDEPRKSTKDDAGEVGVRGSDSQTEQDAES